MAQMAATMVALQQIMGGLTRQLADVKNGKEKGKTKAIMPTMHYKDVEKPSKYSSKIGWFGLQMHIFVLLSVFDCLCCCRRLRLFL